MNNFMRYLLLLLLIFFLPKLALSMPGDTYHCKKAVGQFIDINNYNRDWGDEDFYFKWTDENTIRFKGKDNKGVDLGNLIIHRHIPEQGELFQANRNEGQLYLHYIDGKFTYTHTADGRLWFLLADCDIIDF